MTTMWTPRGALAWLLVGPVLIPLYALYIILLPIIWFFRGLVRVIHWD